MSMNELPHIILRKIRVSQSRSVIWTGELLELIILCFIEIDRIDLIEMLQFC